MQEHARVNALNRQQSEDVHTMGPCSLAMLRHDLVISVECFYIAFFSYFLLCYKFAYFLFRNKMMQTNNFQVNRWSTSNLGKEMLVVYTRQMVARPRKTL